MENAPRQALWLLEGKNVNTELPEPTLLKLMDQVCGRLIRDGGFSPRDALVNVDIVRWTETEMVAAVQVGRFGRFNGSGWMMSSIALYIGLDPEDLPLLAELWPLRPKDLVLIADAPEYSIHLTGEDETKH